MVSFGRSLLAVDWGTTNRRVFVIEDGNVVHVERDGAGVTAIAPNGFEAEAAALRRRFGDKPMLLAGMVGSTLGWTVAPYVSAPAGIEDMARGLHRIDARTAIVPGVSTLGDGRPDVMRGEEVQFLGAVAAGLVAADALLCQPGTHCKWADVVAGRITGVTTALTGEMFALIRRHGVLAGQLGGEVTPGRAFREGVEHGKRRDLLADLFGVRAAKLLGRREDADAASYVSGLLIGADVAARLNGKADALVHILAEPQLGSLYAAAIEANGATIRLVDSEAAFAAGIVAIGDLA